MEGVNSARPSCLISVMRSAVLAELGRLWAAPEEADADTTTKQGRFLHRAVEELAGSDGRVIPVRLSLFALDCATVWTMATLSEMGGMEGIGVTFLEESFSAPTAPPAYRFHQGAAQAVLRALLPDQMASSSTCYHRPAPPVAGRFRLHRSPGRIRRIDQDSRQRITHGGTCRSVSCPVRHRRWELLDDHVLDLLSAHSRLLGARSASLA